MDCEPQAGSGGTRLTVMPARTLGRADPAVEYKSARPGPAPKAGAPGVEGDGARQRQGSHCGQKNVRNGVYQQTQREKRRSVGAEDVDGLSRGNPQKSARHAGCTVLAVLARPDRGGGDRLGLGRLSVADPEGPEERKKHPPCSATRRVARRHRGPRSSRHSLCAISH